jgi:hypothetical protein
MLGEDGRTESPAYGVRINERRSYLKMNICCSAWPAAPRSLFGSLGAVFRVTVSLKRVKRYDEPVAQR